MSSNTETIHNVFYDTNVYGILTRKGNEGLFNPHYESLIKYIPTLDNGLYIPHFPVSSLLEVIGDGSYRDKYKPRLDLSCHYARLKNSNLEENFFAAYQYAYEYFRDHGELSRASLLAKIERQLMFSASNAELELIEATLGQKRNLIVSDYSLFQNELASHLAWDAICEYPYTNVGDMTSSEIRQINDWSLKIFHDRRHEGIDLSSYRLSNRLMRAASSSDEYIEQIEKEYGKNKFTIYGFLEDKKDLVDADIIHFATFGRYVSKQAESGIVITADKKNTIETRLMIQFRVMKFLSGAENSTIELVPGIICLADEASGIIYDKINVVDYCDNYRLTIGIEPLGKRQTKSAVSFRIFENQSP